MGNVDEYKLKINSESFIFLINCEIIQIYLRLCFGMSIYHTLDEKVISSLRSVIYSIKIFIQKMANLKRLRNN